MEKVRTLDDLKKMRERLQSTLKVRESSNDPESFPQVRVSMSTCGIAAGAKEVMSKFISELDAKGLDAIVTQVGCLDRCGEEPTVEVILPGKEAVVYGKVSAARVSEIIDKHIGKGQLAEGVIKK